MCANVAVHPFSKAFVHRTRVRIKQVIRVLHALLHQLRGEIGADAILSERAPHPCFIAQ